jgi:hypothetical protein
MGRDEDYGAFAMQIYVQDIGVKGSYPLLWQLGTEGSEGTTAKARISLTSR